jgi:menaquinone-dependent protoporphyrinogen oxidase
MKVLVVYASRHGATAGIAERIAAGLRADGLTAEARPAGEVGKVEVEGYDAFVIGSAAYLFHWLKDATRFVERHRGLLATRPVWLFSSGPLGTERIDAQGDDVLEATRPREFDELAALVKPRGLQVFFGAWDPDAPKVGLTEQLVRRLPAAADTPAGDFRDWPAIDAWSAEIARELQAQDVGSTTGG